MRGDPWKTTGVDRILVRALSLLGNTERLRQLGDGAITFMRERPDLLGTPERLGEVLLQIARGIASSRDWQTVRERMRPVLDLCERSSADGFRARVSAFDARVALELGDLKTAGMLSAQVLIDGDRAGAAEAVCEVRQVQAGVALAKNDLDGSVELLQRAKLYADRRDLSLWRIEILLDIAAIDEMCTASLKSIESAQDLVGMTESPLAQARVYLQTARTRLARFELDAAEESSRRGIEMCRRYHLPLLREALSVQAQVSASRGDRPLVAESTKEAGALPRSSADRIGFHEAKVILKLVRGDLAGVRKELAQAGELIANDRLHRNRWLGGLWIVMARSEMKVTRTRRG